MKALVLAGGHGTRLRPLTHTQNKHLLPIANEPMIFRVIKDVINAGITEIIVNINKGDTSIRKAIESEKWDAKFTFIEQEEPNGMMYPIIMAKDIVGDDSLILHGGDNVLAGGLKRYIEEFEKSGADSAILGTVVENPERFGVLVSKRGKLIKTVEKPKKPISNIAATAIYMYNSCIFEAMENVEPIDAKGNGIKEYYPPPAHQWLVDNKYDVRVIEVSGWWKDTGKAYDILLANRLVLEKKLNFERAGRVTKSTIEGNVEIMKGTKVKNSVIRGPVTIAEGCEIEDSYIGPFTSVGPNSKIEDSQIENSILVGENEINGLSDRLDSCLLGWRAKVEEDGDRQPLAVSLFLGDDSEVML